MFTVFILFCALITVPGKIRGDSEAAADASLSGMSAASSSSSLGNDMLDFWLVKLSLNLVGYCSIFVPGFFIIRWVRQSKYLEKAHSGCLPWVIRLCVEGSRAEPQDLECGGVPPPPASVVAAQENSRAKWVTQLLVCFGGLQASYLTWGVLQEKIMTRDYISDTGQVERFNDSQFLVFVNRILAFLLALLYILLTRQPRHTAPLYKYSFASLSNILSSWCQYEALKYVSFPTQVLAKASKIIPVMLMGKLLSRKSYPWSDYITAAMISAGMSLFLLSRSQAWSDDGSHSQTVTTFSGLLILTGYMVSDSFTSNWQGDLFTQHKMSSVQMMCGVNFFSCLLTTVSLLEQGSFASSLAFIFHHFAFIWDLLLLSLCSAVGQMFIFRTISLFGAVTFVIIMTVRQGFAILLSCVIYGHSVNLKGVAGVVLVFIALFLRIYASHRSKQQKQLAPRTSSGSTSSSQKM